MGSIADDYFATLKAALALGPPGELADVEEVIFDAFLRRADVYTVGNGASAALGQHIACDWGMSCAIDLGWPVTEVAAPRLKITCLADSSAMVTGYSNDWGFENVFVEQLKCQLDVGDVVVAISGSGNSPNVVRAAEYARVHGALVIGFTGSARTGDELAAVSDIALRAPVTRIQETEDIHVTYNHIVALTLKERVREHLAAVRA